MFPRPRLSRRGLLRGAVLLGLAGAAGAAPPAAGPAGAAPTLLPAPPIHPRQAWQARPPQARVPLLPARPERIVVHHTATANTADTSLAAAYRLSRGIQNYHMDRNGWPDAGQQFTISRGGHLLEGRAESLPALLAGDGFPLGTHAPTQNDRSIGIENEGTYTTVPPPADQWDALVTLCAYLCQQYAIPPGEIAGHREFRATQCPGDVLYGLLPDLRGEVAAALDRAAAGEVVVDSTSDRFRASVGWGRSAYAADSHGRYYHFAEPLLDRDAAWFHLPVPRAGRYHLDAWWPGNPGYHPSVPYLVITAGGTETVPVDQRRGGDWTPLGRFDLAAGDGPVVGVSRWTIGEGFIIADAVRLRPTE